MNTQPGTFRPIFIVGNSRSGTTLMSKILNRNSGVHSFRELHYFERLWNAADSTGLSEADAVELCAKLLLSCREGINADSSWKQYVTEASGLIAATGREVNGFDIYRVVLAAEAGVDPALRVCDQTPRNLFYLDELLNYFPDSQVLVMVRDPRAILLSQKNKWRRKSVKGKPIKLTERLRRWANYHPVLTSSMWESAINAGIKAMSSPAVKQVRFEDLVTRPEQTVGDICEFLGLNYSPSMLEVAGSMSPTGGAAKSDGKGIDAGVAERWRKELGAVDTFWCERANGVTLQKLGYQRSTPRPAVLALAASLAMLPVKVGMAALLNMGKMRNLLQSIRRRFG